MIALTSEALPLRHASLDRAKQLSVNLLPTDSSPAADAALRCICTVVPDHSAKRQLWVIAFICNTVRTGMLLQFLLSLPNSLERRMLPPTL